MDIGLLARQLRLLGDRSAELVRSPLVYRDHRPATPTIVENAIDAGYPTNQAETFNINGTAAKAEDFARSSSRGY